MSGRCIIDSFVLQLLRSRWVSEPNDFESDLIRRCANALDMHAHDPEAGKATVYELCVEAGQSPAHAALTYKAALLLSNYRQVDQPKTE